MKVMGLKPLMETPLKSDYLRHDGARMAKVYGVPFNYHGLKGHQFVGGLPRVSVAQGHAMPIWRCALRKRIFERLWVDGLDITPARRYRSGGGRARRRCGTTCWSRLRRPEGKQALNVAVDEAIGRGVFGVPFFIADGEPIWGCDRLWMLEHWLTHHSGTARAAVLGRH